MKINWDMPASAMTVREALFVAVVQGLCTGIQWQPGYIINPEELVNDAQEIVKAAERDL